MKRKNSKPAAAPQMQTYFLLRDICGTWESLYGSPNIKIYHDGIRFRLQFIYKQDTAFTFCLSLCWGIIFFYFHELIKITYDDERDILLLTTEGEYRRISD